MRGAVHATPLPRLHEEAVFLKALDDVASIGVGNIELPLL
jgi:hypothetical protein